jgi:hypothetical protein
MVYPEVQGVCFSFFLMAIVLMDHSLRHGAQCGGWCAVPVCVGAAALS